MNQIDENIKIYDGSEERYKTGLDSTRAINLDMPKQIVKAENKELPAKELQPLGFQSATSIERMQQQQL